MCEYPWGKETFGIDQARERAGYPMPLRSGLAVVMSAARVIARVAV